MLKSDFISRPELYGRINYLNREMYLVAEHVQKHPQASGPLQTMLAANIAILNAALTEAQGRDENSGPGGGPFSPSATAIDVTPATSARTVGQTQQLTVARTPSNAGGTVTYLSSAPSVATVNSSGLVTAVAAGSATITASLNGHTDTCVVTVT